MDFPVVIDDKRFGDLCAEVVALADEIEATRQLPKELARALADYGLMTMFVPHKIGGGEWDAPKGMAHLQKLAEADAASAWVCMIGSTAALGAAYIDPAISADMFAASGRITCGIFAPNGRAVREGDDFVANGRWAWASGSANADYIGLGCMILERADDKPDASQTRLLMAPREAVVFHDTWHTIGLCGSSSGDVELRDARIPVAHSYGISETPWAEGPLYRLPYFGFLAVGIGAVALGNARAAIDDFKLLAMAKKSSGSSRGLNEMGRIQNGLACAEADWGAAHAFYWTTLNALWQEMLSGGALTVGKKADLRLVCTHAVRQCANVIRGVHDMAGGTSVYRTSTIQRRLRDAETMTQHIMTGPATYEMIGRVMLGGHHDGMML